MVEQNCIYQDLDDKDYKSLHVFCEEEGRVVAYLRAFVKAEGVVQIGRVLSVQHGIGMGGRILQAGLQQVKEKFALQKIYIEAQCYAIGYYEREGFSVCSEEFLEDGIPHVQMELIL